MSGSTLFVIIAIFAAVCLWTIYAGLKKMRLAKENPGHPQAPMIAKIGKIQAIAGAAMLLLNIVLNIPAFRTLM